MIASSLKLEKVDVNNNQDTIVKITVHTEPELVEKYYEGSPPINIHK